jgi:hypothetical protein
MKHLYALSFARTRTESRPRDTLGEMTDRGRSRLMFYGGLFAFLIVIYTGAALLQHSNPYGRPYEGATDIAVPVLIGAFVGRKYGMGWGILAGIMIAAITQIGGLPRK